MIYAILRREETRHSKILTIDAVYNSGYIKSGLKNTKWDASIMHTNSSFHTSKMNLLMYELYKKFGDIAYVALRNITSTLNEAKCLYL